MPQQDIDGKILQVVCTKLAIWAKKPLSMAARILISNQVILASIWYIASCAYILLSVLNKVKAMIRQYIWSSDGLFGKANRAKVRWASVILSVVYEGLKVFDPYSQAYALLAKMIPLGLFLGSEPWKILIRHKMEFLRLSRGGQWGNDINWLFTSKKVCNKGSPIWQGISTGWTKVRSRIIKQIPKSEYETLRQSWCFNPHITDENGHQWGVTYENMF